MGVYASTHFEIQCETKESAKEVMKTLKAKTKKSDENSNTFGRELELGSVGDQHTVFGFEDSGRYQNLDWRCEEIWEAIKNIKGVLEFNAPTMIEGDGFYQSNEEDETV